jgi:delta-aminolevulinic acid dehydratase/porphobilinogen synthase
MSIPAFLTNNCDRLSRNLYFGGFLAVIIMAQYETHKSRYYKPLRDVVRNPGVPDK